MIYEVRILSPEGKLRRRVSKRTLKKDYWRKFKAASGQRRHPPGIVKKQPWEGYDGS